MRWKRKGRAPKHQHIPEFSWACNWVSCSECKEILEYCR